MSDQRNEQRGHFGSSCARTASLLLNSGGRWLFLHGHKIGPLLDARQQFSTFLEAEVAAAAEEEDPAPNDWMQFRPEGTGPSWVRPAGSSLPELGPPGKRLLG